MTEIEKLKNIDFDELDKEIKLGDDDKIDCVLDCVKKMLLSVFEYEKLAPDDDYIFLN